MQPLFTATGFSTVDMSSGIENLPPGVGKPQMARLSQAENVRFSLDGGVSNRLGFEERADLGTSAKVNTLTTLKAYSVMFAKSGTKITQSTDGSTWYDIGVTRTSADRDFLFPHGKDVYATNTTDSFLRIAVSSADGVIADTDTEITVRTGDIDQFDSGGGTIYINGDSIAYTGISGSDLTGVTGIASGGHATGSIITQTSTPSGVPKGTCITELEGSMLIGGQSTVKSTLHYSAPQTDANPEYFYDFSSNGAGTKALRSGITALRSGMGVVMIGLEDGLEVSTGFDVDTGALITSSLSRVHSIPNAFCITEMDQEFAILTSEGRILPVQNTEIGFRVIEDPNNPQRNMDFAVSKFIQQNKDADQSLSFIHYDPSRRELTASIMINGLSQEFVYQRDIGAWSIDTTKNFSCKTNFEGRVYAGDDSDDKIYLDHELTRDDTIPINARIVTGILTVDQKRSTVDYNNLIFGGLLSGAGEFTFRIFVNGSEVSEELVTASDLIDAGLMSTSTGVPLGSGLLGAENIGATGAIEDAFRFTYPYEFMAEGESIQLEWEVTDEGTQFELRDFRIDAETENNTLLPSQ